MFWPSGVYPQGVFKIVTYPFWAHKSVLPEADKFRVVWSYNKSKTEGWYLPFWHGSVAWGACGTCHHRRDRRSGEHTYHSVQWGWSIHRDHSDSHLLVLHLLQDVNRTSANAQCLRSFFLLQTSFSRKVTGNRQNVQEQNCSPCHHIQLATSLVGKLELLLPEATQIHLVPL